MNKDEVKQTVTEWKVIVFHLEITRPKKEFSQVNPQNTSQQYSENERFGIANFVRSLCTVPHSTR
jgi:hypothetical protein